MVGYSIWKKRSLRVSQRPEISCFKRRGVFEEIQVVINVSDTYDFGFALMLRDDGITPYWFPMNESKKDIGLNSLYGVLCVLYYCEMRDLSVLVHCDAGENRSPLVVQAYHYMRTGVHAVEDIDNGRWINRLVRACSRGYLPPQAELEKFLSRLMVDLKNSSGLVIGGNLDKIKSETIFNF